MSGSILLASACSNGGGSTNARVLTAGQPVHFGTADITMTRTASRAPRAYVHFEIGSNADGGLCPNANDIYLVTSAGVRQSLVEAPGNCTSLNAGEKGEVVFASPPMFGAGLWPSGATFVFAPDQGPVVARWAVDGTAGVSAAAVAPAPPAPALPDPPAPDPTRNPPPAADGYLKVGGSPVSGAFAVTKLVVSVVKGQGSQNNLSVSFTVKNITKQVLTLRPVVDVSRSATETSPMAYAEFDGKDLCHSLGPNESQRIAIAGGGDEPVADTWTEAVVKNFDVC